MDLGMELATFRPKKEISNLVGNQLNRTENTQKKNKSCQEREREKETERGKKEDAESYER